MIDDLKPTAGALTILLVTGGLQLAGCNFLMDDLNKMDALPDSGTDAGTDTDTDSDIDTDTDADTDAECVCHVDGNVSESGDGLSWENAFKTLQEGLAYATTAEGCQVWVAAGSYFVYVDGQGDTLELAEGVELYGGFSGGETSLEQRDWKTNTTELNGHEFTASSNQVYHVVTVITGVSDARIDGFTITGGNAAGDQPDDKGGGLHIMAASLTVAHCTFIENSADDLGGGIFSGMGSPEVTSCSFADNTALRGGGIFLGQAETATLTNCVFIGNSAGENGGAIFNSESSPAVINCTLTANSPGVSYNGGAVFNASDSSPNIVNSILWNNGDSEIADDGSACNPTVDYSDVTGGYAGNGNIDADPLFVGSTVEQLQLLEGSPCIDSANGSVAKEYDLEGQPRFDDLATENSGVGNPDYVDMGAYEYQGR